MSRSGDWSVVGFHSDPTPGDPAGVRLISGVYAETASVARETRQLVDALSRSASTGVWAGEAGNAFRERLEDFPTQIGACEASYQNAADAVSSWAQAMAEAQGSADRGLAMAQDAQDDVSAATAALNAALASHATASTALNRAELASVRYKVVAPPVGVSVPTPAEIARARRAVQAAGSAQAAAAADRSEAQVRLDAASRLVAEAHQSYADAARSTVTRIEAAREGALPENNLWDKITRSEAWSVLVEIATVITIIAAIAAFVLTGPIAVIVGVIATAAAVILLADELNKAADGEESWWQFGISAVLTFIPGGTLLKAGRRIVAYGGAIGLRVAPRLTAGTTQIARSVGKLAEYGLNFIRYRTQPKVDIVNDFLYGLVRKHKPLTTDAIEKMGFGWAKAPRSRPPGPEAGTGQVHADHGVSGPYPSQRERFPETWKLVSDPEAPYGRLENGTPMTHEEYDLRYTTPNGRDRYPNETGARSGTEVVYDDPAQFIDDYGRQLDRIGNDEGTYFGVPEHGVPATFEQRALPVGKLDEPYSTYELAPGAADALRERNSKLIVSRIEPGFGREGGGLQARFDIQGKRYSAEQLVDGIDVLSGDGTIMKQPILVKVTQS